MRYGDEQLTDIFEKSFGNCAYCDKQLAWTNYGRDGYRGDEGAIRETVVVA